MLVDGSAHEQERYVDASYGRDNEEPNPWAVAALGDATTLMDEGRCYPTAEFKLHGREAIPFPSYCYFSRN